MPFVIKYCPRCIKSARSSVMCGALISITTYYFWDHLGYYFWILFFALILVKYAV